MKNISPAILLSPHAKEQLVYRGTSEEEIITAIHKAKWEPAELGRLQCHHDFIYNQKWNDKHYKTKQVRPIFTQEQDKIIVITVYVYYF